MQTRAKTDANEADTQASEKETEDMQNELRQYKSIPVG